MSGMLNGAGFQGLDPQMLSQLLGMARQDPFSQAMPGSALLGDGPMAAPQMPGMQQPPMDTEQAMADPASQIWQSLPSLPDLPTAFGGFGFGQFAPEMHQGNPMRQQLIAQLMQMMPQLGQGLPGIGGR